MIRSILSMLVVASIVAPAFAQEKLPPGGQVTRLEASPAAIALKHPYDYRQLLITATLASGDKIDVTRMASIAAPANVAKVSGHGVVRPVGDGQGEFSFSLGGQSIKVPVSVGGPKVED